MSSGARPAGVTLSFGLWVLGIGVVLVLWLLLANFYGQPELLPSPGPVLRLLVEAPGYYWNQTARTAVLAGAGLGVAAVASGLLVVSI
jgi:hypothetical protein